LPTGVTGDVVWSTSTQRGFMRFKGLAVNDPKKLQYQLWIFDKAQDQKHPIDGGVFDIDLATGDVIVPITPKIRVQDATLFAITIEKPGGVVVSSRDRLVLIAKVPAG
jgi:anti-sigma-K factor RskA